MQSVYFTAPNDWAENIFKNLIELNIIDIFYLHILI